MRFRLDIAIDDEEYIDFNKFNILRSPYGNRYILKNAIVLSFFLGFIALLALFAAMLLSNLLLYLFFFGILTFLGVYPIILRKLMVKKIEKNIRKRLANGEKIYTKKQTVEFYDDILISDDGKKTNKIQFSDIEHIFVINRYIYIYCKQRTAFIIKTADFDSVETYALFLDFIESVFNCVKFYITGKRKPYTHPYRIRVVDDAGNESASFDEVKKEIQELNIYPSRNPDVPLKDHVDRS